ncbi:HpcH/HpaI aldolase/citrate lyase family protein [Agrobacterium larrymoorei]|uniref:CoA ester lyase n=1 Tax=Agrobacterium larrymoorei TaxID=160699 RepID=A0A4D7DWT9_9HYPH|nr:CoA ester lyase [Agrobacterium larrymoorei]QCJ00769.1 CoA ester lyase [Agrobacterium larrymoorei]QYA10772.1 CoA ester lyase [Agrobacterium larrymoorei]
MRLRSLLFVPGDRPDRMEKAVGTGADAVILDLEDSVALGQKALAREEVSAFLKTSKRSTKLFVRVNAFDSGMIDDDLSAILSGNPDALVLPKAEGAASVSRLSSLAGPIPILPIATETPTAIFELGSYAAVRDSLIGLTWGAEDLPAAIGASRSRDADGKLTPPYEMVRALTLFGAHAAGTLAIETVYPDFRDARGLELYALNARRDGFTGMMAIHPSQVPIINKAFLPTAKEVLRAREIVGAFEAEPDKGVLQIDGKMVDRPHLKQAQRILKMIEE